MVLLYTAIALVNTLWIALSLAAVHRVLKEGRQALPGRPPRGGVTLLKPLCGADSRLEENLETCFVQDHPDFEIVFGVQGHDDPALAVARRVRRGHPDVSSRIVVHQGGGGLNPKVSNLRAMLRAARYDTVVISDSNVALCPDYLRSMHAELERPGVGLVTHLITGVGEKTVGATLENLHLNGHVASAVALSTVFLRRPAVVGKSVMFRRGEFASLGGFESVAHLLAEDYAMGRMYGSAGFGVRLCRSPVANVCVSTTVIAFVRRHLRWATIRLHMTPAVFWLEPLSSPLFVALCAPLMGVEGWWPLLWALSVGALRDSVQWCWLRGPAGLLQALPLAPLRELLLGLAWSLAPWQRHVSWRGNRVRLSAGTRLYAERPMPPARILQVEG
jgi:ceramide glucosyltransferase